MLSFFLQQVYSVPQFLINFVASTVSDLSQVSSIGKSSTMDLRLNTIPLHRIVETMSESMLVCMCVCLCVKDTIKTNKYKLNTQILYKIKLKFIMKRIS